MTETMWAAIREYIAAEIALHAAREKYGSEQHWRHKIAPLEEQSTRMETEVRRLIAAISRASKEGQ